MASDRSYQKRVVQNKQKEYLDAEIDTLQEKSWYGTFTVVFDNGFMKRLKLEESKIPPQR